MSNRRHTLKQMRFTHSPMFRLWAKALGEKASHNKTEADLVALIRSVIFLSYLVTNAFIVAGVVRHWNN
jgi:hypothetical protein